MEILNLYKKRDVSMYTFIGSLSTGLVGDGFCLFLKTFLNASIKYFWNYLNLPRDRFRSRHIGKK